ncbi:hypothetical protein D3C86_1573180 [compost metagenome]
MARILDNAKPMLLGEFPESLHAARITSVVHHENSLRTGCDLGFDIPRIEVPLVLGANVCEDGLCPHISNGIGCSDKRKRWANDLIPRPDLKGSQS